MKKYYHATNISNLSSIMKNGLKASPEGLVFMTETPKDAIKFVGLRRLPEILVLEIKTLKEHEDNIIETNDHSYDFFKCKCYGYMGDISWAMISNYAIYKMDY